MQNLNKIIIVLLVIGLIYLILNQDKYLSIDYFNDKLINNKKKSKNKKKKEMKGKKNKKKENFKSSKSKSKSKSKKEKKRKKRERFTNKKKIDLIEIDELDKLSFEDLNSNITLGTLDTSISNDDILEELTIDTFDNEISNSL
jgi:FtsZ-interacting cell division protein ZipA